jgi:hypothetical protein
MTFSNSKSSKAVMCIVLGLTSMFEGRRSLQKTLERLGVVNDTGDVEELKPTKLHLKSDDNHLLNRDLLTSSFPRNQV